MGEPKYDVRKKCTAHTSKGSKTTDVYGFLFSLGPNTWPESRALRARGFAQLAIAELGGLRGKHVLDLGAGYHPFFAINAVKHGAKCTVVDRFPVPLNFAKRVVIDGFKGDPEAARSAQMKYAPTPDEMKNISTLINQETIREHPELYERPSVPKPEKMPEAEFLALKKEVEDTKRQKVESLTPEERDSEEYFATQSHLLSGEVDDLDRETKEELDQWLSFKAQDFEEEVPGEEQYDIVHAGYVLTQVGDVDKFVANAKKILKKGGHFIGDIRFPESEQVKQWKKREFEGVEAVKKLLKKHFPEENIRILEKDWSETGWVGADSKEYLFIAKK